MSGDVTGDRGGWRVTRKHGITDGNKGWSLHVSKVEGGREEEEEFHHVQHSIGRRGG